MKRSNLTFFVIAPVFLVFLISGCSPKEEQPQKATSGVFELSLENIPQLRMERSEDYPDCGYFLLTTKDMSFDTTKHLDYSVQIADPSNPWPPLWFAKLPYKPDREITDVKVLHNGHFSFFFTNPDQQFEIPQHPDKAVLEGYLQLNNSFEMTELFAAINLNKHDYHVFPDGRRVYLRGICRTMDLSHITFKGQPLAADKQVCAEQIEIMDEKNHVVFEWYPLDHMNFEEMYYKEYENEMIYSEANNTINFSRINSVNIDPFDGNLLVSFRRSDMCAKVDIHTGEIIWRLGGKKNDFQLDSLDLFYLQHDFKRIPDGEYRGCYTLFSNGSAMKPYSEGLIYTLDEEKMTAKVVKRYRPKEDIYSLGQGNYQLLPDNASVINYGNKANDSAPNFSYVDQNGNLIADYFTAPKIMMYRVTCEQLPVINRPQISCAKTGNAFVLSAIGDFEHYQWSTGEMSESITVKDTGSYYVVGAKGVGGVPSLIYKIEDIHNHLCQKTDEALISKSRTNQEHTVFQEPEASSFSVDLPFYPWYNKKGSVKLDFEKGFYIVKPLAEK